MDNTNSNKSNNDELSMKIFSTIAYAMDEDHKLFGDEVINISGMSKQEIKNMVDNCTRKVKYNPEKMWIDYQALFDKTRNKVLGKTDDIKVRYVNLEENRIARNGLFYSNKMDMNMFLKALDGDLDTQLIIINNIWNYYLSCDEEVDNLEEICYTEMSDLVRKNRLYLISIRIALGKYCESDFNYYYSYANNDYLPTYFSPDFLKNKNNKLIEKMNFYAITRPVMGSHFFDENFY